MAPSANLSVNAPHSKYFLRVREFLRTLEQDTQTFIAVPSNHQSPSSNSASSASSSRAARPSSQYFPTTITTGELIERTVNFLLSYREEFGEESENQFPWAIPSYNTTSDQQNNHDPARYEGITESSPTTFPTTTQEDLKVKQKETIKSPPRSHSNPFIDESKECTICLELISSGEHAIARLMCAHEFHLSCIGSCFNSTGTMQCPNCRKIQDNQPGGWKYAAGAIRGPDTNPFAPFSTSNGTTASDVTGFDAASAVLVSDRLSHAAARFFFGRAAAGSGIAFGRSGRRNGGSPARASGGGRMDFEDGEAFEDELEEERRYISTVLHGGAGEEIRLSNRLQQQQELPASFSSSEGDPFRGRATTRTSQQPEQYQQPSGQRRQRQRSRSFGRRPLSWGASLLRIPRPSQTQQQPQPQQHAQEEQPPQRVRPWSAMVYPNSSFSLHVADTTLRRRRNHQAQNWREGSDSHGAGSAPLSSSSSSSSGMWNRFLNNSLRAQRLQPDQHWPGVHAHAGVAGEFESEGDSPRAAAGVPRSPQAGLYPEEWNDVSLGGGVRVTLHSLMSPPRGDAGQSRRRGMGENGNGANQTRALDTPEWLEWLREELHAPPMARFAPGSGTSDSPWSQQHQ
ncbi:hypothetical protein HK102_009611, partial [Quaeritorhiza haematococci]